MVSSHIQVDQQFSLKVIDYHLKCQLPWFLQDNQPKPLNSYQGNVVSTYNYQGRPKI